MQSILEELYYGNIHPTERKFDRESQYAKCVEIVADSEEKLRAFLAGLPNGENQAQLLARMIDAMSDIALFSELERFVCGFRLGAGIMLETFVAPQQNDIRDIA